jgi:predicted nucleic acid-binding protein
MSSRRSEALGRTLLVDTNLLVLFTVGSSDPRLIERHKRTQQFTAEDYRLLEDVLSRFQTVVTTPNVLTEVSNLVDQVGGPVAQTLQELLVSVIGKLEEQYVASSDCCGLEEFRRLGLADAAILRLAQDRGDLMILTDDIHLYLALQRSGLEAINFNHLREQVWQ